MPSPRLLALSIALSAIVLLVGCTSATTRNLVTGDFAAILEATNGAPDYARLTTPQVWALCQAYARTRTFARYDDCQDDLRARVAAGDGVLAYLVDGANTFYAVGATAEGMILRMEMEAALARGDDATTIERASALESLAGRWSYPPDRRRLGAAEPRQPVGVGRESAYSGVLRLKHQAAALGTLGFVAARRGDRARAAEYGRRLAAIDASGMNATQWRLPDVRALWLARIQMTLGEHEAAYGAMTTVPRNRLYGVLRGLDQALTIVNPVMLATYLNTTGGFDVEAFEFTADFETRFMLHRAALETGRIDEARAGYDAILAEPRVRGHGTVHWQALHGRGRIALIDGDRTAARSYFERAAEVVEAQRRSLDTEAGRVGFVADKQAVYADLVALLAQQGDAVAAFEYVERAKARALVDMLATQRAFRGTSGMEEDSAALLKRLDALETESLRLGTAPSGEAEARRTELRAERERLLDRSPQLASLVAVRPPALEDVQARLAPDEALLEYFGHGEHLHGLLVDRSGVVIRPLDGRGLEDAVAELRETIEDVFSEPEDYDALLTAMYDRLVRPFEDQVGISARLTIVPHGPLHYVPFAALGDAGGPLLARHELRLLPAAAVTAFLDGEGAARRDLLVLGNPDRGDPLLDLPGAEREARRIDRGWTTSSILLRGQASESAFKRFAPSFSYLHLASHGQFVTADPLSSRMLLAPGEGEDGDLTAAELYGLRLDAALVTLSACETGLGDVRAGDDVIGLTRGFLYAGARSIVTSLWEVSDVETAFLMERFYEELTDTSPASALRAAALATRERYPHPAFWSAFGLTGAR